MEKLLRACALICGALVIGCTGDYQIIDKSETRVVVDSYIQTEKIEELDVLISLDTSGSMYDNYEDVANGMEILKIDIENLTLDYQFGYITMDPYRLGYVGPYDSSSSAIDMLMAPSLLPSTSLEEGFAATYGFLSSEEGLDFIRPEADFLLFLISDEEEQSAITAPIFYDWLHEEFVDVRHDVVAITQVEDSECGYAYDIGYKYEEIANLYNKDAIDICAEDWSVWLSSSSYLTELKDYIVLSETDPIIESIVVYVGGEYTRDWEYIEESNTVQLDFVPDYGVLVEAGYMVEA
tara:strand:+ start:57 stop:938 length:882 start_codon:yes stop_codon:yes gene_type:complete